MCGSKRVTRQSVEAELRNGKSVIVEADVCQNCGEQYFDLDAAAEIDRARNQ
jgi:YgiT-type zinc finger domain-containing protein